MKILNIQSETFDQQFRSLQSIFPKNKYEQEANTDIS